MKQKMYIGCEIAPAKTNQTHRMQSRRKFVAQGTLATTALLALRPLESWAGLTSFFEPAGTPARHLAFLHTLQPAKTPVHDYMSRVCRRGVPAVLVNAAPHAEKSFRYDVQAAGEQFTGDYTILEKGGIRTGLIRIDTDRPGLLEETDRLAAHLRESEGCQLVVCMSRLGFRQENGLDDQQIAEGSKHIDMILCSHPANNSRFTRTLFNRERKEVILQPAEQANLPCGKIEISFDADGNKRHIHVATRLYKDVALA